MSPVEKEVAHSLWREAKRERSIARLLESALLDKALSRILLLHREELFPRLTIQMEGNASVTFGAASLPYLSHPVDKLIRSFMELGRKWSKYNPQPQRQGRATELVDKLDEVTRQTLIDNVGLELLKLVQASSVLRRLVTQAEPITYEQFKRDVGDYSTLNLEPTKAAILEVFERLWGGRRSKKALNQIAIELDALKDSFDIERFQFMVVNLNVDHYRRLIKNSRIHEKKWKDAILALHSECFLEHSGPMYLWCTKCPESGLLASIRTTQLLKPLSCPRCGRLAQSVTILVPDDVLGAALSLKDGMLGAAVGWQLTKRGIQFTHSFDAAGTELDFLVSHGTRKYLIECKMNHQLKARDQLVSALLKDLDQLKAHIQAAQASSISLDCAVCVVNHSRARLSSLRPDISLGTGSQDCSVPTVLISYEDFFPWMRKSELARGS